MNSRLSRKYAQALFLAARNRDCINPLGEQLELLAQAFTGELGRFLQSTRLSKARIIELTDTLMQELFTGQDIQLLVNLLQLVVEKGRTTLLPEIVTEYALLVDEEKRLERGHLQVATPLATELLDRLEKGVSRWRGHTVKLAQQVNPALLGGFVIQLSGKVGSIQIDASLLNSMQQLKKQLLAD